MPQYNARSPPPKIGVFSFGKKSSKFEFKYEIKDAFDCACANTYVKGRCRLGPFVHFSFGGKMDQWLSMEINSNLKMKK
mgnify:CR=1 FL=1